jgi:hypothetical protein
MFEQHLLPGRQCLAGRVSDLIVLPNRGHERGHCVYSRHVLRHVGTVVADRVVQFRLLLRRWVELGDRESMRRWVLLPSGQLSGDRVPRVWRVWLACSGKLYRVPGRVVLQCHWSIGSVGRMPGRILLRIGLDLGLAAAVPFRLVLCRGERGCHCVSGVVLLPDDWTERGHALQCWLFLQSDWRERCDGAVCSRLCLRRGLGDGD